MTDNRSENQWRERGWRGKLAPAEQAELRSWLVAHPEAQPDWEAEAALNKALDRLPSAPVASNFTARVLQAIEREEAAQASRRKLPWHAWQQRLRWLPRVAYVAVFLSAGLISYHQTVVFHRAQMARSVATVFRTTPLPSSGILTNFNAVAALDRTPADEELLTLLK